MFCQNCGKEMPNDSVFCPECGAKQEEQIIVNAQPVNEAGGTKSCGKCGCQIPVDSKFCPECRTKQSGGNFIPQGSENNQNTIQQNYSQNYAPQQNNYAPQHNVQLSPEEMAKIKKRNKIIGISVAALIAICLVLVILSSVIKPSINLNKYMVISAEGYETVGRAKMEFDTEKFEHDYEKKLSAIIGKKTSKLDKDKSEEAYLESMFDSFDDSTASSVFIQNVVSGKLDKTDKLSNGDVIIFKWDCDDKYVLNTYGVKLKYSDIEYTVEGLEEAETFDPFEGIEVSFTGISPNGRVEINGTPSARAASEFNFEADKYDNLSVGDKITINASVYNNDDPVQYCIDNYGMVPSILSKEYTVAGLDSYIRSISDVSDDGLKAMQAQAEDVYNAKVASDWGEEETLKGFAYVGNYLLTAKNSDGLGEDNILYLVYKVTVNDNYSNDGDNYNKDKEFYWYISFNNLLVNDAGETTVNVTEYNTPNDRFTVDSGVSSGWWSNKEWYYYGYETIDELYKTTVTYNIVEYNHEENVDENLVTTVQMEEDEEITEDGIIFPNSSDELIEDSKAEELSDEDLRLAINEIYARKGYIFKDEELLEHFRQFDWYEEKIKPDDFSTGMFNEIEMKNVEMLQKERDNRG